MAVLVFRKWQPKIVSNAGLFFRSSTYKPTGHLVTIIPACPGTKRSQPDSSTGGWSALLRGRNAQGGGGPHGVGRVPVTWPPGKKPAQETFIAFAQVIPSSAQRIGRGRSISDALFCRKCGKLCYIHAPRVLSVGLVLISRTSQIIYAVSRLPSTNRLVPPTSSIRRLRSIARTQSKSSQTRSAIVRSIPISRTFCYR